MRKAIWVALLLVAAALACERNENQTSSERPAIPVKVLTIEALEVNREISTTGVVKPAQEVKLSFMLGGRVKEILFEESDWAEKGAVLARLDQTEIEAKVTQARVGLDKARRDLERMRALYEDNVVTPAQFQDATSAFQKAQADLVIVEYNLTHSEIWAPFSGRLAFQFVKTGELIPPGTPAFVLMDIRKVKVEAGVSDRDVSNVRLGSEAEVQTDAYPSETFTGKVTQKAVSADPISGMFKVEITVENRTERLLPGMIARMNIHTQPQRAMFVPIEALFGSEEEKGILFVLDEVKSRVRRREVIIGSIRGERAEVVAGIDWRDKVVAGSSAQLKDGDAVRVVN